MKKINFILIILCGLFFLGCKKNDQIVDNIENNFEQKLNSLYKLRKIENNSSREKPQLKFNNFKEAYTYFTNNKVQEEKTIEWKMPLKKDNVDNLIKSNSSSEFHQYSGQQASTLISLSSGTINILVSSSPSINYAVYDNGLNMPDSKQYYYYQVSSYNIDQITVTGNADISGYQILGNKFVVWASQTVIVEIGGLSYQITRNIEIHGSVGITIDLPQYYLPYYISMNLTAYIKTI